MQILVYGHMDKIEFWVRQKVPAEAVEKVAGEAFMSALISTLNGDAVGEFVNWLKRIVHRRIVDYHRANRVETQPLSEEHGDEEGVRGGLPFEADETAAIEFAALVDQLKSDLEPAHQLVVDLYCLDGYPATEVARQVNAIHPGLDQPMTENNVHAIASRFRRALRDALDEGPSSARTSIASSRTSRRAGVPVSGPTSRPTRVRSRERIARSCSRASTCSSSEHRAGRGTPRRSPARAPSG